jgi:hypothetical protein
MTPNRDRTVRSTAAAIPHFRLGVPRTALEIAVLQTQTKTARVHFRAAPVATSANSIAIIDILIRSTGVSLSGAANCTEGPSGDCQ